ncbi:hypothetical protein V9K67_21615 [Paraflavisolibacter sp. H34]|uniref:hypothetical protein n=1 Tax=Huijunlia imazamoxiresistens TaxID=3127457 RepID=UPI003017820D
MSRYYFFSAPDRPENKRSSVIAFNLEAFFPVREGRQIIRFQNFDKVKVWVRTDLPGLYNFFFLHGAEISWENDYTSYEELKEYLQWRGGFISIDEKSYLRLRHRAVRLMFRHSGYWGTVSESDQFFYSRLEADYCDVQLTRLSPLPGEKGAVVSTEEFYIEMPEPDENGRLVQLCRFMLYSNPSGIDDPPCGLHRFQSMEEAKRRLFPYRDCVPVNKKDYEGFRNFCRSKIWEHYELEIPSLDD